ncbi:MAG TPA: hypothetical protein VG206_23200 [Terriglobia bacterium]|nr:hypothetical protein [Terriglobia bacterium]
MRDKDAGDLPRDGEPLSMTAVFRTCPMVVLKEDGRMFIGKVMLEDGGVTWAVLDDGSSAAKALAAANGAGCALRDNIMQGVDEDRQLEEVDYIGA